MAVLLVSLALLGALIYWLVVVKPKKDAGARPARRTRPAPPRRAVGPDDDEEFQAQLRRRIAEQRRRAEGGDGQTA